jgi:DNA gyrase subunit B/topoisomerase-4 subunit B
MPPLYRVDLGKRTFWADDDEHRDAILAEHGNGKTPEITRFKGLGEMPAKTLWETTLDPASRRLLQVDTTDSLEADSALDDLMGKDPLARFRFIMDHAAEAQEVDV